MAEVVAAASVAPPWKSVRPGKIAWTEKQVAPRSQTSAQTNSWRVMTGTTSKADLADSMLSSIPKNAREIFEQGRFGGGDLVVLDNPVTRPSYKDWGDLSLCTSLVCFSDVVVLIYTENMQDLRVNYVWLKPIVQMIPQQVPGRSAMHVVICEEDNSASPTGAISPVLDGCAALSRWALGQETPAGKERHPRSLDVQAGLSGSRSWEA